MRLSYTFQVKVTSLILINHFKLKSAHMSDSPVHQIFFIFFKYKFIYFNWRLITLQYCIGFAIYQHESVVSSWTVFSECPFRFKRGVIPPTPNWCIETHVFDLHPFCFSCSMRPCRAWMPPSNWHRA